MIALLCALGAVSAFNVATMVPTRSGTPQTMRSGAPQLRGADIPEVVIGKARLALATKRTVGDEDEIRILWQTFKKCYPNEKMAIEAAEKNSNVFNPQLNSPTKITGTFALLSKRFGKKGAQELIMRNPGILICTPRSLEKESDGEPALRKRILEACTPGAPPTPLLLPGRVDPESCRFHRGARRKQADSPRRRAYYRHAAHCLDHLRHHRQERRARRRPRPAHL